MNDEIPPDSIAIHNSLEQIKIATGSLASRFVKQPEGLGTQHLMLQILSHQSHGLKS